MAECLADGRGRALMTFLLGMKSFSASASPGGRCRRRYGLEIGNDGIDLRPLQVVLEGRHARRAVADQPANDLVIAGCRLLRQRRSEGPRVDRRRQMADAARLREDLPAGALGVGQTVGGGLRGRRLQEDDHGGRNGGGRNGAMNQADARRMAVSSVTQASLQSSCCVILPHIDDGCTGRYGLDAHRIVPFTRKLCRREKRGLDQCEAPSALRALIDPKCEAALRPTEGRTQVNMMGSSEARPAYRRRATRSADRSGRFGLGGVGPLGRRRQILGHHRAVELR